MGDPEFLGRKPNPVNESRDQHLLLFQRMGMSVNRLIGEHLTKRHESIYLQYKLELLVLNGKSQRKKTGVAKRTGSPSLDVLSGHSLHLSSKRLAMDSGVDAENVGVVF